MKSPKSPSDKSKKNDAPLRLLSRSLMQALVFGDAQRTTPAFKLEF